MRALKQDIKGLVQDNCYKQVGLKIVIRKQYGWWEYHFLNTFDEYFQYIFYQRISIVLIAINMDYDHMIVDMTTGPNAQYRIYETKEAKRNYKFNGDIDACCGMDKCSAYSRTWIFCGNMNPIFSKFDQTRLSPKL